MAESKKKSSHGGARPGAGRPSLGVQGKLFSFRVSGEMAQFLDRQENRTEFIRRALHQAREQFASPEAEHSLPPKLLQLGEIYPATRVKELNVQFFDMGIVAGFPIPLDNDEKAQSIELLKMLCPCPESSYLIRVEGNSMIDADICSGDIVIVDKSCRNPSPSQVAVCELNGEYTLKRFEIRDGEGWLIPANPNFPEIKVTEADSFSIWGTVTYVIHKPHSK